MAANVRGINLLVIDIQTLLPLAIATLMPYVPVVFLIMPVDQIVQFVLKTVI